MPILPDDCCCAHAALFNVEGRSCQWTEPIDWFIYVTRPGLFGGTQIDAIQFPPGPYTWDGDINAVFFSGNEPTLSCSCEGLVDTPPSFGGPWVIEDDTPVVNQIFWSLQRSTDQYCRTHWSDVTHYDVDWLYREVPTGRLEYSQVGSCGDVSCVFGGYDECEANFPITALEQTMSSCGGTAFWSSDDDPFDSASLVLPNTDYQRVIGATGTDYGYQITRRPFMMNDNDIDGNVTVQLASLPNGFTAKQIPSEGVATTGGGFGGTA